MTLQIINTKKRGLVRILDRILHGLFVLYEFFTCKWLKKGDRRSDREIRTILIVNAGYLGDSILNIPMIRAMRKRYARADIIMLINPKFSDLWKNADYVDDIVTYDAPWIRYGYKPTPADLIYYLTIIKTLRKKKIDMAVDSRGDIRNNWLFLYNCGAWKRVGFDITGGGYFLTDIIVFRYRHEVENSLAIARHLGCTIEEKEKFPVLSPEKETVTSVKQVLKKEKVSGRFFVMAPFAGYPTKEWGGDKFAALADDIVARYDATVLLVGGERERDASGRLVQRISARQRCVDFTGRLSLPLTIALLSLADIFIGCDSGPAHMAAAAGCRAVVLTGPTDPVRWRPYVPEERYAVVRHSVACSPCGLLFRCDRKKACMEKIEPEQVMVEIRRLLQV